MALLQISEPGASPDPHQRRLAAGIDLGTTNSLVATVRSGSPEVLADEEGRVLLPSVVRYHADAPPEVGHAAHSAAASDPLNTIASAKRMIGRSTADIATLRDELPYRFDDSTRVPRILTADGPRSAIEVSAEILTALKKRAELSLGGELEGVVITVPAYFDDAQRQATKDAARLAGLNVLRLLNEPTAAAVAYGLDSGTEGTYAVYDLGGGTFDISILHLHNGVFEVLATAGDSALGGDDMDRQIADWILEQCGYEGGAHEDHSVLFRQVLIESRRAKEMLTTQDSAAIEIALSEDCTWSGMLERATLERLIDPLIDRTLLPCRRVMKDADLAHDELDGIIMVGGSTRVPRVVERVAEFFATTPYTGVDPDQVVAIGAAIQADILVGNRPTDDMLLLDVIPLSLGLEIMGGMVEKVIPRNSTIPVSRAQEFTTYKDGQTAMSIHVLQGERELVSDCRSLARFELRGIPPMAAGNGRVRVTFQVDADGLLNVTAQEMSSGVAAEVSVKPSYGLTDGEIEQMLRDSIEHAQDDMQARRLAEQQVEADRTLEALRTALASDGDRFLDDQERSRLEAAMRELEDLRAGNDADRIQQAIETLNAVSETFAARRMNASIQAALQGHSINEFED